MYKMRTALVREFGELKIERADYCNTNEEYAKYLRGLGYKVIKVWSKELSDAEVDDWRRENSKITKRDHKSMMVIEKKNSGRATRYQVYYGDMFCQSFSNSWTVREMKEHVYNKLDEKGLLLGQ